MEPGQPESKASQKGLIASIIFATVVVSGSLVFLAVQMQGSKSEAQIRAQVVDEIHQQQQSEEEKKYIFPITATLADAVDDDAMMGSRDAKVTLVEFSDYQCPYCLRHFTETFPGLKSDYIDTGKINYVFRDSPLPFHPQAIPAAIAAECARQQGGDGVYFQMGQKIFNAQDKMYDQSAAVYQQTLRGFAVELGLDSGKFLTCVNDPKTKSEIDADIKAGAGFGVEGTPSFVLTDGTTSMLIRGAQPLKVFKKQIDALLK